MYQYIQVHTHLNINIQHTHTHTLTFEINFKTRKHADSSPCSKLTGNLEARGGSRLVKKVRTKAASTAHRQAGRLVSHGWTTDSRGMSG